MSQALTLASSAGPLPFFSTEEDDDIFSGGTDHYHDSDHVSSDNIADKLIDMDFPMFDVSTCSKLPSLPCPSIQTGMKRKRLIWANAMLTDDFLLKKSVKRSPAPTPFSCFPDDDPFIDVLSDSCSITSTESDLSSLDSAGGRSPVHRIVDRCQGGVQSSSTRPLVEKSVTHSGRTRLVSSSRDRMRRAVESPSNLAKPSGVKAGGVKPGVLTPEWCHQKPTCINPREEMNLLRLSCTCHHRSTGKNLHLWEFLLEMLADRRMKSVIAWTGQDREFRVVNSREVAREWGARKNKPHMNFDKMSRAMRYYYKKNILTHGSKERLVYSFGENPICPHYEEIVKLALRTRPVMGKGKGAVAANYESYDPVVLNRPSDPSKLSGAFFKSRKESEKLLSGRICGAGGGGGPRSWTIRRSNSPADMRQCSNSCCDGSQKFRSRAPPASNKTLKTCSSSIINTTTSSQNKIKITKDKKHLSDQFTFP